jgi:RND family efflux transporter MFP subunit
MRVTGFLAVLGLTVAGLLLYSRFGAGPAVQADASKSDASARQIAVATTSASERRFEERLVVQGNLEAKNFAMVPALIPGTLEAVYVNEGDCVVADETELFQVDSLKVAKALEVRKQELAVARCGLREKEANQERVQADFDKAKLDHERFKTLFARGVVPEDALEQQESRYKQTAALLKHARTLVNLGEEQVQQAEAAVAISEKDLSDSLVRAPLSGVVSLRLSEAGEMADVGKPVVRIEDPSVLEVSAFLPAQYYPRVTEGKTPVRVSVYGIDVGERTVTYKSPTIHPQLRTFEVKCVIEDPPDGVVPGAMAELQVLLEHKKGLGVPAEAVQLRADHSVVFVVAENKAKMVPVETGLETDGWLEVRSGQLEEGMPVVTLGQYLVNDGAPVTVQKGGA